MILDSERRRGLLQLASWLFLLSSILLLGWLNFLLPTIGRVALILLCVAVMVWWGTLWRSGVGALRSPLDVALWLLLLAIIVATLTALDPMRSMRMAWQWVGLICTYYAALTFFRNGWDLQPFIKALLLAILLAFVAAYYQLYTWWMLWVESGPWPTFLPPNLPRVWGLSSSPNILAIMSNLALFPAVAYWRSTQERIPRLLLLGFGLLAAPLVVLTASRSGWLGLLAGGLVFTVCTLWQTEQRIERKWMGRLLAGGMVGVGVLAFLISRLRPGSLTASNDGGVGLRTRFWQIAVESWSHDPLTGHGLNNYSSAYLGAAEVPFETLFVAAHNIYMQVLADMGLLGLAAVFLLTGTFLRFLWRQRGQVQSSWLIGWFAALTAFFIHALFDTPETWIMFLAVIMVAAVVAELDPQPEVSIWQRRGQMAWPLLAIMLIVGGFIGNQAAILHEQSITQAEMGEWDAALATSQRAAQLLPFDDGAILQTQALIHGSYATVDRSRAEMAIQAYQRLIMIEPSWAVSHANLAALYWQTEQPELAIAQMDKAIRRAPEVASFYLTLAVWQATLGDEEAAIAAYGKLLRQARTWRGAPYWESERVAQLAVLQISAFPSEDIPAGSHLLLNGEYELAVTHFTAQLTTNPYNADAQVGLAMAQLALGQMNAAGESLKRAHAIDTLLSEVGTGGTSQERITLWRALHPDASQERRAALLNRWAQQSPFGAGTGGTGYYSATIFGRSGPPSDMLPQLLCPSTTAAWATEFGFVQAWIKHTNPPDVAWIQPILQPSSNGISSCWPPLLNDESGN